MMTPRAPIIRRSQRQDGTRVMEIWRASVAATHDFLAPADRDAIDEQLQQFLPTAPLWLLVDQHDIAQGFMLLDGHHMEALFLHPDYRGIGAGRALVEYGVALAPDMTTDVNEQNEQAAGFYRHMGFVQTGRSATDGDGRPYPLLHLRYCGPNKG